MSIEWHYMAMEKRLKTKALNFRTTPERASLFERAARESHRSQTQLFEMLVDEHLKANGYLPEEGKAKKEGKRR